jgi:hypothetical protein
VALVPYCEEKYFTACVVLFPIDPASRQLKEWAEVCRIFPSASLGGLRSLGGTVSGGKPVHV